MEQINKEGENIDAEWKKRPIPVSPGQESTRQYYFESSDLSTPFRDLYMTLSNDINRRDSRNAQKPVVTDQSCHEKFMNLLKDLNPITSGGPKRYKISPVDWRALMGEMTESLQGCTPDKLKTCLISPKGKAIGSRLDAITSSLDSSMTKEDFVSWYFTMCYQHLTYDHKLELLNFYYTTVKAQYSNSQGWNVFLAGLIDSSDIRPIGIHCYRRLDLDQEFLKQWITSTDWKSCFNSLDGDAMSEVLHSCIEYHLLSQEQQDFLQSEHMRLNKQEYIGYAIRNSRSLPFEVGDTSLDSIPYGQNEPDRISKYLQYIGGVNLDGQNTQLAKKLHKVVVDAARRGINRDALLNQINTNRNCYTLFFSASEDRNYVCILEDLAHILGYQQSNSAIELVHYPKVYFTSLVLRSAMHTLDDPALASKDFYHTLQNQSTSLLTPADLIAPINRMIARKEWSSLARVAHSQLVKIDGGQTGLIDGLVAFTNQSDDNQEMNDLQRQSVDPLDDINTAVMLVITEMDNRNMPKSEIDVVSNAHRQLTDLHLSGGSLEQIQQSCLALSNAVESKLFASQTVYEWLIDLLRRFLNVVVPTVSRRLFSEPSYQRHSSKIIDLSNGVREVSFVV